jgi:hypothetical protein
MNEWMMITIFSSYGLLDLIETVKGEISGKFTNKENKKVYSRYNKKGYKKYFIRTKFVKIILDLR